MPTLTHCFALTLLAATLRAQETKAPEQLTTPQPPVASSTASETSEVPQVPGISGLLRGLNAGLTISGLHDAQTGWATIAQPAVGYSFNEIFSFDVTVPIYMYRLAGTLARNPPPDRLLVTQRAEPGDVLFGLHAQFVPRGFLYQATVSASAPTGDTQYGLSTGRATFDFSNRLERSYPRFTPSIEIGVGDSSTLVNPLVLRNFTSLGPLAHFQSGFSFPLPFGASFDTSAYEQLPIGDQKIYRTVARRNGSTRTFVTGRSVSEDNGFTNSLDLPLDGHTTLSAYYNPQPALQRRRRRHRPHLRPARQQNKEDTRTRPADSQLLEGIQQQLHPAAP